MDDEQWRIADYAKADLNQKLIIGFLRIGRTMRKQYEGRGSQKRVLILIQDAGGSIAQKELTRRLGIQPGSVSEILGKLEKSGLLRRKAHAADRRAIDLILTEEGKEAAKEASDQRAARHEKLFSSLSEDEKETLRTLLEKINASTHGASAQPEKKSRTAEETSVRSEELSLCRC